MDLDYTKLLNFDSTTLLLASVVVLLLTLRSYLQAVPLAHPILLGRQSDVAKVRRKGESSVYRNYGVGHGSPLPARPRKDIIAAHDFIQAEQIQERTFWETKISNEKLRLRLKALAAGLVDKVKLTPLKSTAFIVVEDSFEWLLVDLALSSIGVATIAPTKLNLLSPILDKESADVIFTDASLLDSVLEEVAEQGNRFPVVVTGTGALGKAEAGRKSGHNVFALEEIEAAGKDVQVPEVAIPADHTYSTIYYGQEGGAPVAVKLTHQNLTAGPTSIRSFFSLTTPFAASSTIFSAFPLATPFGRAILYSAVLEGSNFRTLDSTSLVNPSKDKVAIDEIVRASASLALPRPTHLLITPKHLESITSTIISHAGASFFGGLAWARKQTDLASGALSDKTVWDRIGGLSAARRKAFGYDDPADTWLQSVVVAGGPSDETTFPNARLALSVPLVNAHISPLSTGPLFASHPFDLQHFPPPLADDDAYPEWEQMPVHVGPPGANIEVKLVSSKGNDDGVSEENGDPKGRLFFRGPTVGQKLSAVASTDPEGWIDSGETAKVQSNGVFRILS